MSESTVSGEQPEKRTRMPAEERRRQLLRVARACFSENGYAHTTTAVIARNAQVSEPILYRHFASKFDLFHAILVEFRAEAVERFESVAATADDGATKLLAVVRDFPYFSENHEALFRMVSRTLASVRDDRTVAALRDYYDAIAGVLGELVLEGQSDGTIRAEIDPVTLAWMLVMTGIGMTLMGPLAVPALGQERNPGELTRLVKSMIVT